jgi:hypothetical protein
MAIPALLTAIEQEADIPLKAIDMVVLLASKSRISTAISRKSK